MKNSERTIRELLGPSVSYRPIFAKGLKSVTAGVLLSQLFYWDHIMGGETFYKTDAELRAETCLSIEELKTAKAKIKALPFVKMELRGVPAKTYYSFDIDGLSNWISTILLAGITPTEKRESRQQESVKDTNSVAENPPTLHRLPEITHETTTREEKEAPSPKIESFNYSSETNPFDAEPTIEKSEKRYLEASQKIKNYFAQCPDDMILICDLAKKKLSPARFAEELDKWLSRNVENLTLIQNPVARLKFGESSFKSWIEKPWVSEHQEQKQSGYANANRNTETANERITRVASGAIEFHNELLAKHGLL